MRKTIAVSKLMISVAIVLVGACAPPVDVEVDETEVAIHNGLTGIPLSNGLTVDSVHVYGLVVGDLHFDLLRANETTAMEITEEYGVAVPLTADSLAVFSRICNNMNICVTGRFVVADLDTYRVSIERYEENTLLLDTTVLPVDTLFGTTKVKVENRLQDVTVTNDSGSVLCQTIDLYGVRVGTAHYDSVPAGTTTGYEACGDSSVAEITIDSMVASVSLLGPSAILVWDSIPIQTTNIDAYVANTVRFDGSSASLLNNLGVPRQRPE